jgi:uracil phosphoribosyltransferase
MEAPASRGKKPAIVRCCGGIGMADGLLELIPSARVGHGLCTDESHRPVEYLVRLSEPEGRIFIPCDPMTDRHQPRTPSKSSRIAA